MTHLDLYLDQLHILWVMGGSFLLMIFGIELGYRFGSHWPGQQAKAQPAQVRALMGAALGLFGFMLAFSFSIAQSHYEYRTQAYLQEISAISSTYLSANYLDPEIAHQAQALLKEFVDTRVQISEHQTEMDSAEIYRLIRRGEQIHHQLWRLGQDVSSSGWDHNKRMFSESVKGMIDANEQRKQAAIYNRVSPVLWVTLALMSVLAMLITGYQAGLTGSRSRLATWSLAFTFAAVMALVIDLDRPRMSLFQVNQQQMYDLQSQMQQGDSPSILRSQ